MYRVAEPQALEATPPGDRKRSSDPLGCQSQTTSGGSGCRPRPASGGGNENPGWISGTREASAGAASERGFTPAYGGQGQGRSESCCCPGAAVGGGCEDPGETGAWEAAAGGAERGCSLEAGPRQASSRTTGPSG